MRRSKYCARRAGTRRGKSRRHRFWWWCGPNWVKLNYRSDAQRIRVRVRRAAFTQPRIVATTVTLRLALLPVDDAILGLPGAVQVES